MRKYQQGGQLSDTQQQGLQYLAQMYAQQTGKDPQQDQEGFMLFVQQLALQAGVQDIGQLLDMIYQQAQGQAQAARRGAKLNYLKRLTGNCPEGEELVYLKVGGKVCSKCVAKKDKCGAKVKMNMCGSKVKKDKCGVKINKKLLGGSLNGIPFIQGKGSVKPISEKIVDRVSDYLSSPSRYYNDVIKDGTIQRTYRDGSILYIGDPNMTENQLRNLFLLQGKGNVSLPTVTVSPGKNPRMYHYNPLVKSGF